MGESGGCYLAEIIHKNTGYQENICEYFSYGYFEPKSPIIKKIAKLPQLGEVSSCGVVERDITTKIVYKNFTNESGKKEAEKLIEFDFGLK